MKRLAVLFLASVLLLAGRPAIADDSAQQLVRSMSDEAIVLLSDDDLGREGRLDGLRRLFTKYMDLPFVARFVLGRHWRQLSDKSKAEFIDAFEEYVVNIYAKRLQGYSGQTIHVGNSRAVNDKDTLVSAEIRRDAGPPVALEWRVRDGKVIDVTVEGVSMAISQREEFANYLQRASIDDLITRLKRESSA